jgi:small subunit ribosomal protein S20
VLFGYVYPEKKFFTNQETFAKLIPAMPVIKSAIKKDRQDKKARIHNRVISDEYKKAVKAVKKLVLAGDTKKAAEAMNKAYSSIDKAAKKKVLHKNNAARRKSRLAAILATDTKTEAKPKKETAKK